tara:strand:+ start:4476 stop:6299 length:1824 start_codon:yes stop_codon:yes gene_type:complete
MDGLFGISGENVEQQQAHIWSTDKIDQLMGLIENGGSTKGIKKPFYDGNPQWRLGNIVFDYTEHELSEIKRCAKDITYFAENYCTVMTDDGLQRIKLRDYQIDMLKHFVANRFSVCLASRQIGKTICSAIFIAWYLLFNFDKNALILANKGATTKEILDKTKVILGHLPFFLKPGLLKNDVYEMKFDNGCRMVGQTTTGKAGIGFTIHLLFLDEFAHVHANFVDSFYENVYPTLSSSKVSRIIITSTPNGYNLFYNIYKEAVSGDNEYAAFKVDWWQVPGRDENWKEQEVKNLGSDEAFNRQYGNQFLASSNLLLQASSIKRLQANKKKYIFHDFEEFENIQMDLEREMLWHPEFDTVYCKDTEKFFLLSVDTAEGNGGDYSVINIFEVRHMQSRDFDKLVSPGALRDFFGIYQIGCFSSNERSIEDFSKILYSLAIDIFEPENIKIVLEWNYNGALVMKHLQTLFPQRNEFDESMICRFKHRHDAKSPSYGLKVKKDNKIVLCQNFKKYIEQRRMIVDDENTIKQLETFGKTSSGNYGGQLGNDDLAMSSIIATEYLMTSDFSDFVEEIADHIDVDITNTIEELLYKDNQGDGDTDFDIYSIVGSK